MNYFPISVKRLTGLIIISPYCPQWGIGPKQWLFFTGVLSFAIACASPHDKPTSLNSVSTVFLQVVLGLPLFLLPAGVHVGATLGILSVDIRKTCPRHLSRRFLISRSILVHPAFWYRSLLEILLGQKMLQILRRQLLWKALTLFMSLLTILQHSEQYSSTDLTLLL